MDDHAPLTVPDSSEPERPRWTSVVYDGDRAAFRRMLVREVALIAATLGIYWFWARTRVRRFVWAHTRVNGSPLEYSGKGLELFIGFVVAGILFALLSWLIDIGLATMTTDPAESILASIAVYGVFFAFVYAIAAYRRRRYLVRRTAWRGIRCGLAGTGLGFLKHVSLPAIATALTLGIAFPWLSVAIQRYLIGNMSLGSVPFRYEGYGRDLLGPWIAVWLLALPTAGYSLVWWRGRATRYHYDAVRLNGLVLESSLRPWHIVGLYFLGAFILSLVLYLPASLILTAATQAVSLESDVILLAVATAGGFAIFLALSWGLYLYFVEYRIIEHGLQTLLISGSMDWSEIEQVHPEAGGAGDGLDAVLGMDGI